MRIFLLRLLLGWWIIPLSYIPMFIIGWLLVGNIKKALDGSNEFASILWNGEQQNE